jgi:predicted ATPase
MSALRKALGDGRLGRRYVENISGRGYRWLAPVTRLRETKTPRATQEAQEDPPSRLPARITRMIGREEVVSTLASRVLQQRFVTIVGPGGIGKTTVALAIAERLSAAYPHGALFVDLAPLTDQRLVVSTLASVLGVTNLADDPLSEILKHLSDRQMLIVFDNCEHVIDVAAQLVETVLMHVPGVRALTTSREPLRATGESVYRLQPLAIPPPSTTLTRAKVLAFPALELFVERAVACLNTFELQDADVPIVAEICRKLDGNPLSIELAAARVDMFSVRGLATRLDDCFQLLTRGRRTSLARHQTLRATLDWSYELLSPREQVILRRIAVFTAAFDLESATAVATDDEIGASEVFDALALLVAKSLLTVDISGEQTLFRLLDTPRLYALEKLTNSQEGDRIRLRHASYCCTWGAVEVCSPARRAADWWATNGRKIQDVRKALDWCLSPDSRASINVTITLTTLWFYLMLILEYVGRRERALRFLSEPASRESQLEMQLNVSLADALLDTQGFSSSIIAAFDRALEFAQRLDDGAYHRSALWGLWIERIVAADYQAAIHVSKRFRFSAARHPYSKVTLSDRILAVAHLYAGHPAAARYHAERLLARADRKNPAETNPALQLCQPRTVLSRALWLQGFVDQAVRLAREFVTDGLAAGHVSIRCFALCASITMMLWVGDLQEAKRQIAILLAQSSGPSLGHAYWRPWVRCFEIVLALRNGEIKAGQPIESAHDPLWSPQHLEPFCSMSEELVTPASILRAENGHAGWCTAEILRVKAERLLKEGGLQAAAAAEDVLCRARDVARAQGALIFELRVAMSFASLRLEQGRPGEAHEQLASVYDRFTEGFETSDLLKARRLLQVSAAERHALL